MTEVSFKVFESYFEIWFVTEPENAYILSLPNESASEKTCRLFHRTGGKNIVIKAF